MNLPPLQLATYDLVQWSDIVVNFATIAAIMVAGFWSYMLFHRRREKYPRAKIEHFVTHRRVSDSRTLVFLKIKVTNISQVLLAIQGGHIWIHQIDPCDEERLKFLVAKQEERGVAQEEADWPIIAEREFTFKPREVEPNEPEYLLFDFIVPSDLEFVRVYSYIENTVKRETEIGWRHTTDYSLTNVPFISQPATEEVCTMSMSEKEPVQPDPAPPIPLQSPPKTRPDFPSSDPAPRPQGSPKEKPESPPPSPQSD